MKAARDALPAVLDEAPPLPAFPAFEDPGPMPGLSLAQVLSILRAHGRRSLYTLLALILAFGVIIKLLPKSYVATATLIVNQGDRDPLATRDLPPGWQNTFIPTQIELIRSAVVLQPVIDRLHLLRDPEFTRGFSGPPSALREAVLTRLYEALNVSQGAGSDLLYVAATSARPSEAAAIANAVAAEYLKLNRQRINEPAAQRARVYGRELADLRAKTIEAQNQVAAFRQRHGMIDLAPGPDDEAEAALRDLEQKLLAAQNTERSLQARKQAGVWGSTERDATTGGEETLAREQAQLARLRASLGPRHPTVLALQAQIAATRDAIAHGLSAQLLDAQRLVGKYQAAVAAERQTVLARRRIQDEGTKLLLELQSVQATYKRALDGYPQIEFASSGNVSDVSLVSRAVPPVLAVKPHKIKYFLASCVLSLGLALGLPFVYELLVNRRLRCRDDFERHFGIPVLAQFGPIDPPHDPRRQRPR